MGSELLGQHFDDPKYFWSRPSAMGAFPNNALSSTGSKYGATNPAQFDAVKARLEVIRKAQLDGRMNPSLSTHEKVQLVLR